MHQIDRDLGILRVSVYMPRCCGTVLSEGLMLLWTTTRQAWAQTVVHLAASPATHC